MQTPTTPESQSDGKPHAPTFPDPSRKPRRRRLRNLSPQVANDFATRLLHCTCAVRNAWRGPSNHRHSRTKQRLQQRRLRSPRCLFFTGGFSPKYTGYTAKCARRHLSTSEGRAFIERRTYAEGIPRWNNNDVYFMSSRFTRRPVVPLGHFDMT